LIYDTFHGILLLTIKEMNMATVDGLKKLRRQTGSEPVYPCSNCKCKRYSPCNCIKADNGPEKKTEKPENQA